MDNNLIINIGRQFGSGGRQVANEIGRILGIPVYDRELLARAAKDSGFSEAIFEKRDEKRRFLNLGYSKGLDDTKIFEMQSQTIKQIAQEGPAIFIGRASNYVLREHPRCLNVFIHAPMSLRRKKVAEQENITELKAEAIIFKKDKGRAEYYNFFTCGHWGKSSDYHMCIDSSVLGVEKTAELIIEFGRKAGLID